MLSGVIGNSRDSTSVSDSSIPTVSECKVPASDPRLRQLGTSGEPEYKHSKCAMTILLYIQY